MKKTLTLIHRKRMVEPVKIKFKKKDGTTVFMDATKITTKPVKINFEVGK